MVAAWNNSPELSERIRVKIPDECHVGDLIEIRTLIKHPMETGNRKNSKGQVVGKNIIKSLTIKFIDRIILNAEFGTGISENPFVSCWMKVTGSGDLSIVWEDDQGKQWSKRIPLNVI